MRRLLCACALVACAAATACGGGPPGDLFLVQRTGDVPGARLTLRLTDDGGAYCNDLGRREISSQQLLDGREIRRELNGESDKPGPADRNLSLPPRPGSVLSYRVRSEDGTVTFSDNSRGQPPVFFQLAKLTRDVARQACGLPR